VPASSKANLLLAKAEPIGNGGSTSVMTHLRRRKNNFTGIEEWEYVRETALQSPQSVQEEGRRCSRQWSRDFAVQPWSSPWWGRLSAAAVELHGGADPHLQPGEDPTPEQGDAWRRL